MKAAMRAMVIEETGGPEVLRLARLPRPEPRAGEVLIRVSHAGVNPADWKNRQGLLVQYRPYVFPCVIGFDAAGVVAAVGEGVTDFQVGDRVFTPTNHGQGGPGSYAEYTVASVDRVAFMPPGLGFDQAAALPVPSLTAWQGLLDRGNLQPGQQVLIHGGSGSVGRFAVQLARRAGARVAATCSTHKVDDLLALGAERVIDYRREDIAEAVTSWAPEGLDGLMDTVGASTLPGALSLVRSGGTFVSIPTLVDDGDIAAAMTDAECRNIRRVFSTMTDTDCAETLQHLGELVARGALTLPPLQEYPLRDAAEAHRLIQAERHHGKIVLKVTDL